MHVNRKHILKDMEQECRVDEYISHSRISRGTARNNMTPVSDVLGH